MPRRTLARRHNLTPRLHPQYQKIATISSGDFVLLRAHPGHGVGVMFIFRNRAAPLRTSIGLLSLIVNENASVYLT